MYGMTRIISTFKCYAYAGGHLYKWRSLMDQGHRWIIQLSLHGREDHEWLQANSRWEGFLCAALADVTRRYIWWSGVYECRCFELPTSKFVSVHLAWMVCSKDTKIYTGSGWMSLCLVRCCSCYRHYVCSRVTNGQERERILSLWWMELSLVLLPELRSLAIASESSNGLRLALVGHPTSPFIGQGEGAGYMREREREREK
jgi:hypothetical protein